MFSEHLLCFGCYPRALLTNKTFPSSTVGYRPTRNRICHQLILASWSTPVLGALALNSGQRGLPAFLGGFVLNQVGQSRLEAILFWEGFPELNTVSVLLCPVGRILRPSPIKYTSVSWLEICAWGCVQAGVGQVLQSPLSLTAPLSGWVGALQARVHLHHVLRGLRGLKHHSGLSWVVWWWPRQALRNPTGPLLLCYTTFSTCSPWKTAFDVLRGFV